MLQPNKWLPAAMLLPILHASNNAAGSLCCSRLPVCCSLLVQYCRLPMLQLPTCGDTALQVAPYKAPNSNAAAYTAGCQPWQYRTASGSLQCCTRLPMLLDYNNAACSLCCTDVAVSSSMLQLPTVAIPHCNWLPTMLHEAPSMLRLPTCGDTARGSLCCLITTMQHAPYAAPMLLAVKLPAVNCPPNNCQPSLPAEKALPAVRPRLIYSCSLATPLLPAHWPSPADYRPATSAAAQPIRPLPLYTHVNSFERMSATIKLRSNTPEIRSIFITVKLCEITLHGT
jgi:hypothetical protein